MEMGRRAVTGMILITLAISLSMLQSCSALQVGFYNGKCGSKDVESEVAFIVESFFDSDPKVTPALLRLQFHDCFVNGCDASILLYKGRTEKYTPPNLSLRGYDYIEIIKTQLEELCPGVVSCADIIAMATRDAVALSADGGAGGRYVVETGRQDGIFSSGSLVKSNLPSHSTSVSQSIALFASKGLNVTDMVILLGSHTVGIAHCSKFYDRLDDFQGTGKPDPSMDATFAKSLISQCKTIYNVDLTVDLDKKLKTNEYPVFDNTYYSEIIAHRGILQIDQDIALDPQTSATVSMLSSSSDFLVRFGEAMIKLGSLQSGFPGEIRKNCSETNIFGK